MPMRRTLGNISLFFAQFSVLAIVVGGTSVARAETTLLDVGYRQMYNLQFDQAHRTFSEWQRLHPEDPMGAVSDAATYLFTEFDRLQILRLQFLIHAEHGSRDRELAPDPLLKQKFEAALNRGDELTTLKPQDPSVAFASVLSHGLQSEYLGFVEKLYGAAWKEVKTARIL